MIKNYKINGIFKGKDILSLNQFDPKSIGKLFKTTKKITKLLNSGKKINLLSGTVTALLFYEPSTRTFSSFSSGIKKLGGQTVEYQNPMQTSSSVKGETLEDTIQVFSNYANAIVMRHFQTGAAKTAANVSHLPIINGGDGSGEHPTQALYDIYTIYERFGKLNDLVGLICGDALYGRGIHSLIRALSLFKNNTLYLLAPKILRLSRADFSYFINCGIKLIEIDNEKEIPKNAHFWYWTRIQKERFKNEKEAEKVNKQFISRFTVTKNFLKKYGNKNMILMHILPRVGEISTEVDNDPRSIFLTTQVKNGMYIRMALIALVLGKA